jgi:two-component system chemotaxis response regulator CheB
MDGLETLRRIKQRHPEIDVIMVSGVDRETARVTVKALESGALDFISKPRGPSPEQNVADLRNALGRLISMARTRKYSRQIKGIAGGRKVAPALRPVVKTAPSRPAAVSVEKKAPILRRPNRQIGRIELVAIGVSTGGPNALQEIVPLLRKDFPLPLLVVQHMPAMFTASLAARLDAISPIRVVEGADGQPLDRGTLYVAPGGRHMVVRKNAGHRRVLALIDSPPVNSCRPAVDVLFRSLATVCGGHVLMVILTGMGSDGLAGVTAVRRKGGYALVQDEKSSVIWGMPGAVAEADQADEIVPLSRMAARITEIVDRVEG